MKKKNNIGWVVAIGLAVLVSTNTAAYYSGKNSVKSALEKEVMKTKKVQELKQELELNSEMFYKLTDGYSNHVADVDVGLHDVTLDIWALSDTLHLVAPSYVKDRLDKIAVDIISITKLE